MDRVAAEITERTGRALDGQVASAGVSAPGELSVKINYLGTVRLIEALTRQGKPVIVAEELLGWMGQV